MSVMISRIDEAKNDLIISEREAWVSNVILLILSPLVSSFFGCVWIHPFLENTFLFLSIDRISELKGNFCALWNARKLSFPCTLMDEFLDFQWVLLL